MNGLGCCQSVVYLQEKQRTWEVALVMQHSLQVVVKVQQCFQPQSTMPCWSTNTMQLKCMCQFISLQVFQETKTVF